MEDAPVCSTCLQIAHCLQFQLKLNLSSKVRSNTFIYITIFILHYNYLLLLLVIHCELLLTVNLFYSSHHIG